MERFRLVCRDGRGEWYIHEATAESPLAAFDSVKANLRAPYVVIPAALQGPQENTIVQRWRHGAAELNDCLNCGYDVRSLMRATDGLAVCPECGVGAIMRPLPPEPETPSPTAIPNFKPGATLEAWGVAFSIIGFIFFPLAILGILLGAFAHEFSRGARGKWAMRLGTAALIIGFLIFFTRIFRF